MKKIFLISLLVFMMVFTFDLYSQQRAETGTNVELKVGVFKVNITPPLNIPLGGYSNRTGPATYIRDPLNAVVIVFDDGETKAAILTLDIIQVKYNEGQQIYSEIEKLTGIKESNIILNASHTHGSPWLETDSVYSKIVAAKLAGAVKIANDNMQPVSIGYGEGCVDFNVSRRKVTEEGKLIGTLNKDGLTDHRVKILMFDVVGEESFPKAIIFHVACHPNVFRWKNTKITADFPGEAKLFIEKNFGNNTTSLFLQGCTGDIRANLPEEDKGPDEPSFGRNGNESDMIWCGWSTGATVVKTVSWLNVKEQLVQRPTNNLVRTASGLIKVSAKEKRDDVLWPREHIIDGKAVIPVKIISIGDICFVALPGEPVIGYSYSIEKQMQLLGFKNIFVLGYSDGDVGYIPTKEMFEQGGYEVTESALLPSCEEEIIEGVKKIAKGLRQ